MAKQDAEGRKAQGGAAQRQRDREAEQQHAADDNEHGQRELTLDHDALPRRSADSARWHCASDCSASSRAITGIKVLSKKT